MAAARAQPAVRAVPPSLPPSHAPPSAPHAPCTPLPPPPPQSHFDINNAEGFTDIGVQHPAPSSPAEARRFVALAAARAARPVTLAPGQQWGGEVALTRHPHYWPLPPWEEADLSGVPIPPVTQAVPPRRPGGAERGMYFPGA